MLSTRVRPRVGAVSLLCASLFTSCLGAKVLADTTPAAPDAILTAHLEQSATNDAVTGTGIARSIDVKVPSLLVSPQNTPTCGIPNPTPFPINLRVGALLSPKGKLDLGIDLTLPDLHILPSLTTRLDGDVIFGANIGGSQTIIPITFDQLYSKSMAGQASLYFGGGVGMYLGGRSRFGGKLVLGATFNRFGVEANLHFSGSGDPLLSLQGRVAL